MLSAIVGIQVGSVSCSNCEAGIDEYNVMVASVLGWSLGRFDLVVRLSLTCDLGGPEFGT